MKDRLNICANEHIIILNRYNFIVKQLFLAYFFGFYIGLDISRLTCTFKYQSLRMN